MNRIYPDSKGNLRHGNIEIFLEIAVDNYLAAIKNESKTKQEYKKFKERNSIQDFSDLNPKQEKELNEIFKNSFLTNKLTIQSIIMLTVFFESLINEIGCIELGQKYFKENLDRMSITSKWEIVLKLIYKKSLSKESQYYENLKALISTRNNLIHYKTKKIIGDSVDAIAKQMESTPDYFSILKKNMSTLEKFYQELREIDQEKNNLIMYNIGREIKRI
ncbi:hypothetical protein L1I30_00105 [Gillisia sp. M10.2A]|uniref:RiboL-PSP-HEPN domain-containing protein n=1 Tax=Gillisia lutea TaxID=2909668 RepID=A0ABS9EAZ7_9FLAO|nr:hypothetical protein [Gillisia lutea]MCF4100055.1 hypothetical protein [Gillisia lutea]